MNIIATLSQLILDHADSTYEFGETISKRLIIPENAPFHDQGKKRLLYLEMEKATRVGKQSSCRSLFTLSHVRIYTYKKDVAYNTLDSNTSQFL